MRTLALLAALSSGCTLYFEEDLGDTPPEPSLDQAFGSLRWAVTIGGPDDEGFARVAVNQIGDVIVGGSFRGAVELDGVVYDGGSDSSCFIMPLDGTDGTPRWVVPLLAYSCFINAIEIDAEGNIVVAGSYGGTVDFGGEVLSTEAMVWTDMFVASYTPTGELRWVRGLGPVSGAYPQAIAVAADGGVYVAGYYYGSSELGGEWNPAENESEAFVLAYGSDGTYRWGHAFIADGSQGASGIGLGGGDLVVSGFMTDDTSMGGDVLLADAQSRSWLARYTLDGEHVWSRALGPEGAGASSHPIHEIRDDGTIIVASNDSDTNMFPDDVMIRAFDLDGDDLWSAPSLDRGLIHAMAIAPTGAVLLAGFFDSLEAVPFGSSMLNDGMALVAHDPAGLPIEGKTYSGTSVSNEIVSSVAVSPLGATAIAASFERTIDIGTGDLVSAGDQDILVAVFNAAGD